LRTLFTK